MLQAARDILIEVLVEKQPQHETQGLGVSSTFRCVCSSRKYPLAELSHRLLMFGLRLDPPLKGVSFRLLLSELILYSFPVAEIVSERQVNTRETY